MLKIPENSFGIWPRMHPSPPFPLHSPSSSSPFIPISTHLTNLSYDLRENVNATALESWDDEFPLAKVTKVASKVVRPPRVAESPVQFECKVHSILRITGDSLVGHSDIVIGRVVGIHLRGEYITPDGVSDSLFLFSMENGDWV